MLILSIVLLNFKKFKLMSKKKLEEHQIKQDRKRRKRDDMLSQGYYDGRFKTKINSSKKEYKKDKYKNLYFTEEE